MSSVSWISLVVAAVIALAGPRVARLLPPAVVVRWGTALALLCAGVTGLILALAAELTAARVEGMLRHGAGKLSVGGWTSVTAGILAAAVVSGLFVAAVGSIVRSVVGLIRASRSARELGSAHAGLVVVHDDVPAAFAVTGARRVVVSTAMLQALDAGERRVLLAHERAHLRQHHQVYIQLAKAAAAANPLLRPLARVVRLATERWADETAAAEVGDRRLTARALARAALMTSASTRPSDLATRLEFSSAMVAAQADLPGRVRQLLAPPPARARAAKGLVIAAALVCAASGGVAAAHGHAQVEHAQLVAQSAPTGR
jgi:beta-lactamase regulating signal transducer with metallopeptidase domain